MRNVLVFLGREISVFFLSMTLAIGWLNVLFWMLSFDDTVARKIGVAAALALPLISFVKSIAFALFGVDGKGPFYDSIVIVAVVLILPSYKMYDLYARYCESCVATSTALLFCFAAIGLPWAAFQICSEVLVRRMIRA